MTTATIARSQFYRFMPTTPASPPNGCALSSGAHVLVGADGSSAMFDGAHSDSELVETVGRAISAVPEHLRRIDP
jgi:hypothetical protein